MKRFIPEEVIVEQGSAITSPLSAIAIFTQGGAVARVADDATAFAGRSAAHDASAGRIVALVQKPPARANARA